jgi:imidazolonepropionase-like amidohydrolase
MRTALAILASVAILSCGAPRSVATARQPELVITGATLIDGTGALPRSGITIVLREGRVAAVTPDAEAERFERATVIDAAGTYVIPGLADMHVHFGLGVPLRRQSTTTDEVLARELYYGVTTILKLGATDGSTEMIRSLQARRVAGTLRAPYIYGTGGHLTLHGTHPVYTIFPTDVRRAADSLAAATPLADPVNLYPLGLGISIVRTEAAARSAVRERAEGGMAAIKITVESGPTTFGDDHPQMSVEMIRPIVDEAARHDLPVFAHISSRDELEAVLEWGAAGVVHTPCGTIHFPTPHSRTRCVPRDLPSCQHSLSTREPFHWAMSMNPLISAIRSSEQQSPTKRSLPSGIQRSWHATEEAGR